MGQAFQMRLGKSDRSEPARGRIVVASTRFHEALSSIRGIKCNSIDRGDASFIGLLGGAALAWPLADEVIE